MVDVCIEVFLHIQSQRSAAVRAEVIIYRKAQADYARPIGGPEKAYDADVTIAAHAVCVRTTMPSLASNRKFLRFPIAR